MKKKRKCGTNINTFKKKKTNTRMKVKNTPKSYCTAMTAQFNEFFFKNIEHTTTMNRHKTTHAKTLFTHIYIHTNRDKT